MNKFWQHFWSMFPHILFVMGIMAAIALSVHFIISSVETNSKVTNQYAHPGLIAILKAEEGYRRHYYTDSAGNLTIAYGFNLEDGVSEQQGTFLLVSTLQENGEQLERLWPPFKNQSEKIQIALLDMAYQLGADGVLKFDRMLSAIVLGNYQLAANEALNSEWDGETPKRAQRVAKIFRAEPLRLDR